MTEGVNGGSAQAEFTARELRRVVCGYAAIAEHDARAAEAQGVHGRQLERVQRYARLVRAAAQRIPDDEPAQPEAAESDKELAGYLNNDAKIRFCNAFSEMWLHYPVCRVCRLYLKIGDGDLCDTGKAIIVKELGSGL